MDPDAAPESDNARELRILVLHNRDFVSEPGSGGDDSPRDMEMVSRADVVNAAQSVARALAARGHFVEVQGIDRDDLEGLLAQLRHDRPDLVFNLCESLGGDDRHEPFLPALLELLSIPYSGSGPICLGLCKYKYLTKQILRAASIPTPLATLLPAAPRGNAADLAAVEGIGYPLFLKLAEIDGSVGISGASIVNNDEEFILQLGRLRARYRQPVLAEHFVAGRELYISLLGNSPPRLLPLQEIDFSRLPSGLPQIVSENAKWAPESIEFRGTPSVEAAPLPAAVQARALEAAARTFAALDIRDYGRCDIRLSEDGTPYVIDVNPNCDLSDGAGYSRAAALGGLSYDRLIEEIALAALQRNAHVYAQRPGVHAEELTDREPDRPSRPPRRSATAA